MSGTWNGPLQTTSPWQKWPGAGIPTAAHPPDTVYKGHNNVPQYPLEATCSMLGEQDPYFPITWHLFVLVLVAFLLYIVWPLYVLRHLIRKVGYPPPLHEWDSC